MGLTVSSSLIWVLPHLEFGMADRKNLLCSRSSAAHANTKLKFGLEADVSPPSFVLVGVVWCKLSSSPQIRAFWLASQVCKDQADTLAATVVFEQELQTMFPISSIIKKPPCRSLITRLLLSHAIRLLWSFS